MYAFVNILEYNFFIVICQGTRDNTIINKNNMA